MWHKHDRSNCREVISEKQQTEMFSADSRWICDPWYLKPRWNRHFISVQQWEAAAASLTRQWWYTRAESVCWNQTTTMPTREVIYQPVQFTFFKKKKLDGLKSEFRADFTTHLGWIY